MFNKRGEEDGGRMVEPMAGGSTAPGERGAGAQMQKAAIGSSMHIKGEISTREELLVDGQVEGSLQSESLLTVGPSGRVAANIRARDVVIQGTVKGNVDVSGKLAIRGQGSLVGDIRAAGISIDDGAYFKGSIDITRPETKPQPAVVAEEAPPKTQTASG